MCHVMPTYKKRVQMCFWSKNNRKKNICYIFIIERYQDQHINTIEVNKCKIEH